jgi:hypothetical protein
VPAVWNGEAMSDSIVLAIGLLVLSFTGLIVALVKEWGLYKDMLKNRRP